MSRYDHLCDTLLDIHDGKGDDDVAMMITSRMREQSEYEEAVWCAVSQLTALTRCEWERMSQHQRIPWLETAIAEATRRRNEDSETGGSCSEPSADPPLPTTIVNAIELSGEMWHIQYQDGGESGDFKNQKGSVFHHLVRLLTKPNRRFKASEFFRPAEASTDPILHHGRDESSDGLARTAYEKEMRRLAEEIKAADDAHDVETAERLREEFNAIKEHLTGEEGARKRGRKKRCGTPSPSEKADQNLRMLLRNLYERLRTNGLPKLADHLDKCITNSSCEWLYVPIPETSSWQITMPTKSPK